MVQDYKKCEKYECENEAKLMCNDEIECQRKIRGLRVVMQKNWWGQ